MIDGANRFRSLDTFFSKKNFKVDYLKITFGSSPKGSAAGSEVEQKAIAILSQSWRPETITRRLNSTLSQLLRYFNKWKLRVNVSKTELKLFTKRRPPDPQLLQFHNVTMPWSNTVKYLRVLSDSKPLFAKHLQIFRHNSTGTFLKIFPLLVPDSPLTIPNKILLYKVLLHSMITYAAPVWSSTSLTNYRHLQVY